MRACARIEFPASSQVSKWLSRGVLLVGLARNRLGLVLVSHDPGVCLAAKHFERSGSPKIRLELVDAEAEGALYFFFDTTAVILNAAFATTPYS